jgi:hypothetical protein
MSGRSGEIIWLSLTPRKKTRNKTAMTDSARGGRYAEGLVLPSALAGPLVSSRTDLEAPSFWVFRYARRIAGLCQREPLICAEPLRPPVSVEWTAVMWYKEAHEGGLLQMAKKKSPRTRRTEQSESRKVGILLPSGVYGRYEEIARDERITVAQVIARVAIEFVEVESEASRSRRTILGSYKDEMLGKSRLVPRSAARRA